MVDNMWEVEELQRYYEQLVERVTAEDLQIDHTFLLCKYIAKGKERAFVALFKVLNARSGEYVAFHFTITTSLDEGTMLRDLKARLGEIGLVFADNAAGGMTTIREQLGAKHALRDIFHIIQLIVESTAPGHVLRPMLSVALSHTFYQLDVNDLRILRAKCQAKAVPLTAKVIKEARRNGKVRAYVRQDGLKQRLRNEMEWWQVYGINPFTTEKLMTHATMELVERVCTWIDNGEVADPDGLEMYTNLGTEDDPHFISRRGTSKVEGSNPRDHRVFQPGRTGLTKAHRRLLWSVVRRNHKRQHEHRKGPNFGHFNFKLVDKMKQYHKHFGYSDPTMSKWEAPTRDPQYKLGIKTLCEEGEVADLVRSDLDDGRVDDEDTALYEDVRGMLDPRVQSGISDEQAAQLEANRANAIGVMSNCLLTQGGNRTRTQSGTLSTSLGPPLSAYN
ncbi:hypothetical protein CYMTET_49792 [Cymbomonas tetramitiformis]|uniref:Transposase n=1 Tax=Cymbomonas tetramitiformis TaxID=36881 RepID=A0AAE0BQP9_9CHLO|nr:hypothetical protein CYMTET_49792 [Cymbomonas tetramitiformis]